jgi:hypothetical protein
MLFDDCLMLVGGRLFDDVCWLVVRICLFGGCLNVV